MLSHNSPSMETHGASPTVTNNPLSTSAPNSFNTPITAPVVAPIGSPTLSHTALGSGFIKKQTRRASITLFIVNLLVIGVGGGIIVAGASNPSGDDGWLRYLGGAFVLLALWNFGQLVRRAFNPMAHPILKNLAQYGPVQEVAARIDSEIAMPTQTIGGATLTANWLVRKEAFGLACVPLEQIVWVYKKVTQHYHNGIPTGKSYTVMINSQNGRSIELNSKKKGVDEVLQGIARRAPWAITGHSAELARLWSADRASMIAAVLERRDQMAGAAPTSSLSG